MGEEGGAAGNKSLNLVADTLLLAAAGWGLQSSKEHPYAAIGFGLFAAKGLLGIVAYASDDSTVSTAKTEVSKLAKNFGIPCFVAEMTVSSSCIPKEFAPEFFLIPLVDWACRMADKEIDKVYLTMSHGHTLGVANACALKEGGAKETAPFSAFLGGLLLQDAAGCEYSTAIEAFGTLLMWATMEKKMPF